MRVNPPERGDDGVGERLDLGLVAGDPSGARVERPAGIFAAEHRERVLLRARIAENLHVLVLALQQSDRRIEHDGRVDQALLLRGDRGRLQPDPDHRDGIGIHPVLVQ